jgi:chromate reductase, NAD(P)H dehydrogenase (quinone)
VADKQLDVLVICGSLRKGSYNAALARTLPALAPAGLKLRPAPAFDKFPIYNHDIQDTTGFPAEVKAWADAIRGADGLIIVSPEYNWSIPGGLKNAIDWMSRMKDQPFKDKPVAIQSCSQGPLGGARMQYHWRMSMTFLAAFIFGTPEIFVGQAQNKFDKDTLELKDQPTKDIVKQQLAAFAKYIRRMKAATAAG